MGRNINQGEGLARFVSVLIKLAIVALIIYGVYYFATKNDVAGKVKESREKTIEKITGVSYDEIERVSVNGSDISIDDFKAKFQGTKYKSIDDMKKLAQSGTAYFVYTKGNKYAYELDDLGDGYIKVIKDMTNVYQAVNN